MSSYTGRERKPITALFADIVDSTAMAEKVDPEDWAVTVNRAFDLMAAAVEKYGGTVAQFLGDGILAFFGAPVAHEDDPQRAVWAALDMLAEAADLPVPEAPGDAGLRLRIGINTGPVIVGNVGNLGTGTYSATGDTLNTAARVQALGEPSTVTVTDGTYRLVSRVFEGQDLGRITVKGKAEPVHCYRVTGPRPVSRVADAPALNSAIVGRDRELTELLRLLADLEKGRGGAAFVVGEPGIGKSRLIREARSSASSRGLDLWWLEGRALSYGSGIPYGLVVQVVRSVFGTGLATGPEEAAQVVESVVGDLMGTTSPAVYPFLAHLLAIPVPPQTVPESADPETLQQLYVESLSSLLRAAAGRRPVVVICEDLHWSDPSSAALLSKLLAIATQARVLFIFSTRLEPGSAGWRLIGEAREVFGEALSEVRLDSFSPAESAELAAHLVGGPAPEPLEELLVEVTEGNPLFIEEVVRTYLSRLGPEKTDWDLQNRAGVLEGSYSLHSLLLSSIDRLADHDRRLVRVASVIGRDFSTTVLESVMDEIQEPSDVARRLSALEVSGLVAVSAVHPELQYSFRHALLQEAAYGSLLKPDRRRLHHAVGSALERVYPERRDELAGLLARHFAEAGEDERTLGYSIRAADAAFSRYATVEAAEHYARAVEIAGQSNTSSEDLVYLFVRLGRSLELTDRYDDAVAAYRRLEEAGRARGVIDLEVAGLVAGATALVTPAGKQDIDEAERLARRALELARQSGDRAAEGRSLWNLMLAHNFSGRDPARSVEFGEQALAIARELGGTEQVASTLLDLHWAYLGDGQIDRSFQALQEATRLWEQIGDKAMLADSLASSSGLKLFVGDLPGVIDDAEQARVLSEEAGSFWGQSYARLYVGYALYELGRTSAAIEVMSECIRLAQKSITIAGQVLSGADLALILVQTGSVEEGVAMAQRGWEMAHQGSGAYRAWAAAGLARIHILLGDLEEAASLLQTAETEPGAGLFMPLPVRVPLGLARAELALAKQDFEECLRFSHSLAEDLERLHLRFWLPQALLLEARACAEAGKRDQAVGLLMQARSMAADMGASRTLGAVDEFLNQP